MFSVNEYQWQKQYIGKKVWYKDTPAVIKRFNSTGDMVFIVADNDTNLFPKPASWSDWSVEEWNAEYGSGMYVDITSNELSWR